MYGSYNCENWTDRDVDIHNFKPLKCQEVRTSSDHTAIWCECSVKYSGLLLITHFNVVCCHWSYALCISRISKAYYLDIERKRCSSGYQFATGNSWFDCSSF